MKNELTESLEKYLLAIYEIVKTNKAARVKDVANYLNIGMPSTSEAVKTLAERKFINYVPYGIITMTKKGQTKAQQKITRHKIISNFLEKVLMINTEKVQQEASQIEYSMNEDVLDKFVMFLDFMDNCSCKEPKWIKSYKYYSKNSSMPDKCKNCTSCKNSCGCCS